MVAFVLFHITGHSECACGMKCVIATFTDEQYTTIGQSPV